jgi:hypothetical protein
MTAVEDLAKLLHLGSPLVAAVAIYAIFRFLDDKASEAANATLVAWIKGEYYKRVELRAAILAAFDYVYRSPLFSWRSFGRSAFLSLIAGIIYFWLTNSTYSLTSLSLSFALFVAIPLILVDYFSLFLVRNCLRLGEAKLFLSIIIAAICVAFAVVLFLALFRVIQDLELGDIFGGDSRFHVLMNDLRQFPSVLWYELRDREVRWTLVPTLFVYLWLPLLLLGAAINSALTPFFVAAGRAQWFIKRGEEQPFEAIGITTSVVVFICAAVGEFIDFLLLHH